MTDDNSALRLELADQWQKLAIELIKKGLPAGERFLASTDVHGKFAGIPIVVQVANAVNHTKSARAVMEKVIGVHQDAWLPDLATRKFRSGAPKSQAFPVQDGAKTPGKVAIYSTCYINYNEPGIGHDLLKVLRVQQSFRKHYLELYADQAHFIHAFRQAVGYTPVQYRKRFGV